MAWEGYWSYGGTEVINVGRIERYMQDFGWFKPTYRNASLPVMLGEAYTSPLQDNAPWVDPDEPDSYGFFGVYPLSVEGAENSSRMATVTESTRNGGSVAMLRHSTKTVVFSAALLGESDAAVNYGMMWLRRVLLTGSCEASPSALCSGADLRYFSAEPYIDLVTPGALDPEECRRPIERTLRRVVFNEGPSITARRRLTDGSVVWTVTFTGVAQNPHEHGWAVPLLTGFPVENENPYALAGLDFVPTYDEFGSQHIDADCAPVVSSPIVDPLCPAIILPPSVPSIPLGCYNPPSTWLRRSFEIPRRVVPLWGEVAPVITIRAVEDAVRNLRFRFYSDPDSDGITEDEDCDWLHEAVVSYVPLGTRMVIDTSEQAVWVIDGDGKRRRADSLVFSTDGTPVDWFTLSCDTNYFVAVDSRSSQNMPGIDVALAPRSV